MINSKTRVRGDVLKNFCRINKKSQNRRASRLGIFLMLFFPCNLAVFFLLWKGIFFVRLFFAFSGLPCFEQCCYPFITKSYRQKWRIDQFRDWKGSLVYDKDVFALFSQNHFTEFWCFHLNFEENEEIGSLSKVIENIIKFNKHSNSSEGIKISKCLTETVKFYIKEIEKSLEERKFHRNKFKILHFFRVDRKINRFFPYNLDFFFQVFIEEKMDYIGVKEIKREFRTIHFSVTKMGNGGDRFYIENENLGNSGINRINFVVPIKNRREKFIKLVENFKKLLNFDKMLSKNSNLRFIFFDFDSNDIEVDDYLNKHVGRNIRNKFEVIKEYNVNWNKVYALHRTIESKIHDDYEIIFITDVDMILPLDFAERIRSKVIFGKMVYVPVCFSIFEGKSNQNSLIKWENKWSINIPYKFRDENNYNGWWRIYGTGMIGFYKGDYVRVGGYDTKTFSSKWGLEDTDMLMRFAKNDFIIFRTRELNYFHSWHQRSYEWIDQPFK